MADCSGGDFYIYMSLKKESKFSLTDLKNCRSFVLAINQWRKSNNYTFNMFYFYNVDQNAEFS